MRARPWKYLLVMVATISSAMAAAQDDAMPDTLSEAIPADIFLQMMTGDELVGSPHLGWVYEVVTVAFDGGSDALRNLIAETAQEWTAVTGRPKFSFRDDEGKFRQWSKLDTLPAARIRIGFEAKPGTTQYWSTVGVLAERIQPRKPTMNFGGLAEAIEKKKVGSATQWKASYEHSVVLHEFGHALGLQHEHFNPKCQSDLRVQAAIDSDLKKNKDISAAVARFNIDAAFFFAIFKQKALPLNGDPVTSPEVDQQSVMLYNFDSQFLKSGTASPCKPKGHGYATEVSAGDKKFIQDNYKKKPTSPY